MKLKEILLPSSLSKFEKFLIGLLFARLGVIGVRSFLILCDPELWRQVVTLGVSLRYWMRWTLEESSPLALLPAVLDSGDSLGIMPMEFPILNIISAPWFLFGPSLGRAFAVLFINILVLLLVLINAKIWKNQKILGISPYSAMLLLPIFSINLYWSVRFMPDFISMILVCMAVGMSWNQDQKSKSYLSCALATLGLLMKPTAVTVFALLLVHENRMKKWKQAFTWVGISIGIAGLYYTVCISWIEQFMQTPLLVGVKPRAILPGIQAFFSNWPTIIKFYLERGFFPGGAILVLGVSLWCKFKKGLPILGALWLVTLIQYFIIAILDGVQLFYNHDYYLLGLSPAFCLLFTDAWKKCEWKWLNTLFIIGICIPLIEACLIDLRPLFKKPTLAVWSLDRQCRNLTSRHPEFPWRQAKVFRSSPEDFPMLGLYFGERTGSTVSEYGFFWTHIPIPPSCQEIDREQSVLLAKCH